MSKQMQLLATMLGWAASGIPMPEQRQRTPIQIVKLGDRNKKCSGCGHKNKKCTCGLYKSIGGQK